MILVFTDVYDDSSKLNLMFHEDKCFNKLKILLLINNAYTIY